MPATITPMAIPEVLLITPQIWQDERGYFMETFRESELQAHGVNERFVQDNQSQSSQGVLRGLHYQKQHPQGKLVRVLLGEIFDVAVDIRPESPTFGHHVGVKLNDQNKQQLYVPPGFAHGFYVMSETAVFVYKCTDYYHPEDEGTIAWNDPTLNIQWPLQNNALTLSERDQQGQPL